MPHGVVGEEPPSIAKGFIAPAVVPVERFEPGIAGFPITGLAPAKEPLEGQLDPLERHLAALRIEGGIVGPGSA